MSDFRLDVQESCKRASKIETVFNYANLSTLDGIRLNTDRQRFRVGKNSKILVVRQKRGPFLSFGSIPGRENCFFSNASKYFHLSGSNQA